MERSFFGRRRTLRTPPSQLAPGTRIAKTGGYPSFASRRIDVPRVTMDELSPRRACVSVSARDQNAHQIGHLILLIPYWERNELIPREEWTRV
jgi:hypothetical protein